MLTQNQEKYLLKIPVEKTVKILPYDANTPKLVARIIKAIKAGGVDLEVKFMGAGALGIAGQGDLDLYIYCSLAKQADYIPRLEKIFGPKVPAISIHKWEFERNGHKVELYLADPREPLMQEQIRTFEILRADRNLRAEYGRLKFAADGLPFAEYMRRKYEFFNKILALTM